MAQPNPQQPNNIIAMPSNQTQANRMDVPYSEDAEKALIGSILIAPMSLPGIQKIIKADDFYFLRYKYIFEAIERLAIRKDAVDNITVADDLQKHGHLDLIGGPSMITHLIAQCPTSVHSHVYAHLIQRASKRRELIAKAESVIAAARDETLNIEKVMEWMHDELGRIEALYDDGTPRVLAEMSHPTLDDIECAYETYQEQQKNGEAFLGGIPTGINDLDTALNGLHRARVNVVAARTGVGKTGFMTSVALNASQFGKRVLFVNCGDGTDRDVFYRLVSMDIGIPSFKIMTGQLTPKEYERAVEGIARAHVRPIHIMSKRDLTPMKIRLEAKSLQQEYGLDLLVIDYIQKLQPTGYVHPSAKPVEKMKRVSQELLAMAPELNIPILIGAQINRAGAGKDAPMVHHIKDCGNIEEDADVILILHRQAKYDRDFDDPDLTQVIIGKNRVTGVADKFIKTVTSEATGRFYNYTILSDRRHVPRLYERSRIP